MHNFPLIVCDSDMNNSTISIVEDLTKRNTSLSAVLTVGDISEKTVNELEEMNITIEEVHSEANLIAFGCRPALGCGKCGAGKGHKGQC